MTNHISNRAGQQLGNYRLLRALGAGGFAEVYLGEHIYLKTQAAIKVLKVQMIHEDVQGFLQEAQTIAHLEHPNIVRVLDFGVQDTLPFLVMNYAPHGSLRSRHPDCAPLALTTIVPYIKAIASALHYAHEHTIIHRDVKPDNMLLGRNDEVLLSDFGIAVVSQVTASQKTLDAMGTPAYMAPEQFQGKPRPASDQYAFAVVVYEWLCGKRPFDGDANTLGYQHTHTPPPPLHTHVPSISPIVEQIVLKALAKDPFYRFETITHFADALECAIQGNLRPVALPAFQMQQQGMEQAANFEEAVGKKLYVEAKEAKENEQECFLCRFNQLQLHAEYIAPCEVKEIRGHLLVARERLVQGKSTPTILVDLGTKLASITLDVDYYRELVKDVIARDGTVSRLSVVIYHLSAPTEITEYKGKPLYSYSGTSHTLVVLEPDTLLNITDLSQADYCNRKYLLGRLVSSPPSAATIRGNLIHHCFTKLLKKHSHSKAEHEPIRSGTPLETLQEALDDGLALNAMEMGLANVSVEAMRTDVMPHLESLAMWYEKRRVNLWGADSLVRAETLLLVPEIGLRGRLDVYWQQAMNQSLLELKTGGSSGDLPKSDHRRQVHGYQMLLAVRQNSKMKKADAKLLYSGTPGQASDYSLRLSIRELQRINSMRNLLVLSHVTGVPPTPPPPSRCTKCSLLNTCEHVSALLNWQPPQPNIAVTSEHMQIIAHGAGTSQVRRKLNVTAEDREFFTKYYQLLLLEGKAGEKALASLWQMPVKDRVAEGKAIDNLLPEGEAKPLHDGYVQTFQCDENQSELRKGDEVLVSDGDPIKGEVVAGTILEISSKEVTVWIREQLESPLPTRRIDGYENDLVHVRTLQNLLRWLETEPHLRDLVAGRVRPRFVESKVPYRKDFNDKQREAVERAMQMQDYLLVHGPPGTGKTSVIAEMVKRLIAQGQRVLLAAFTNQAVDNMLKRLDKEGFHEYVRLGHERNVVTEVQDRLLKAWLEAYQARQVKDESGAKDSKDNREHHELNVVQWVMRTIPVVASTAAAWSSDKYMPQALEEQDVAPMQFDVAIIDEASQLTVPAILGALRFAKRFILVGDDKQLPPLVLSEDAAKQGLADSLFVSLKKYDDQYWEKQQNQVGIRACVSLTTQYRMNRWISNFSSTVFYEKKLVADKSIENRRLEFGRASASSKEVLGRKALVAREISAVSRIIAPEFPLAFLDVRGELANDVMKMSNAEARAVRDVVGGLLARGVKGDIGIIAPYRAQVANIRRHLFSSDSTSGWQGLDTNFPLSVDTVDRFQGGERAVIIMSFATASEPAVNSPRREFLTNPNRLNVALTRAQCKLILVGCVPALERLPIFDRLITYCRSMKTVIPYP